MGQADHMHNEDLDVITLWALLRRGLPKLLIYTLAAGGVTFGVLSMIAPQYTSEAQLSFSSKTTNAFPDGKHEGARQDTVTTRLDREAINTHVRALMAPALLLRVGEQLSLAERPEFNSARGSIDLLSSGLRLFGVGGPRPGESDEDRVLAAINSKLVVSAARESRSIGIRFSSADRRLAAEFANTLAEFYRKSLVDVPVKETTAVVEALLPKIEQLKSEVLEAEAAAERYRAETDQFRSGSQAAPVNTQRLTALNEELTKAEGAVSTAESKWITAHDLSQSGTADVLPEVQSSPVIQGLIAQRVRLERQVFEAQASLLPAHPRMKQLNSDLRGLKKSIAAQVQQVVLGLEKDYRAAAVRVESIKRQLAELKTKVVSTSGNEAQLNALESTANAKRAELERLLKQVEDNKTLAATRAVPVEAQIVSAARISGVPTFPKKIPFTLLAMAATFILGLALMAARAIILAGRPIPATPTGAHEPSDYPVRPGSGGAARALRAPETPDLLIKRALSRPAQKPGGTVDAALSGIGELLASRRSPESGFRCIVAGEKQPIDPTEEALALANQFADDGGQVIVVDWCLEGRGSAESLGVAAQPGIMELLAGAAKFEDVIVALPNSPVHFIPCGVAPDEASVVLEPDGLNLVLDALDEVYQFIIVVGRFEPAQALFEAIEGRFDAGITICDSRHARSVATTDGDTFLGFEVTDIEVIRYERSARSATSSRRMQIAKKEPVDAL
jgi:polysaccharide biosynthesis transport protein